MPSGAVHPNIPRDLSIAGRISPERPAVAKLLPGVMGPGLGRDDTGGVATSSNATVQSASVHLDAGCLDDRPPAFGLFLLPGAQCVRRLLGESRGHDAELGEALLHLRACEDLHHAGV